MVTSKADFSFPFLVGNRARIKKKMDAKTRKKLSLERAFPHTLLQVIAMSQLISHNKE
jgi:hypothetical protein